MRPTAGFCVPQRSPINCRSSVATAPSRRAWSPTLQSQRFKARRQLQHLYAAPESDQNGNEDDVPGGYQDSLSSNTELGRAVQDACDELDNLSSLVMKPLRLFSFPVLLSLAMFATAKHRAREIALQEKESLTKADELLHKLGYKGSILQDTPSSAQKEQDQKE